MKTLLVATVSMAVLMFIAPIGGARAAETGGDASVLRQAQDELQEAASKLITLGMAIDGPAAVVEKTLDAKRHAEFELHVANRDMTTIEEKVAADAVGSDAFARDQVILQANLRVQIAKQTA